MRHRTARTALGLSGALLLAAATACSSSSSSSSSPAAGSPSTSGSAAGTSSSSALSGSCGTIPNISYNDQSGLVSSLGSYASNYNGFNGTIYKSPWSMRRRMPRVEPVVRNSMQLVRWEMGLEPHSDADVARTMNSTLGFLAAAPA